jgi:hypothetical protein
MRSWVRSILVLMILGSASAASAEQPDAGTTSEPDAGAPRERDAENKHPRLVKPKRDGEDNAQLGGEPSLTEAPQGPGAQVNGEQSPELGVETEADDCDLDCLEARLQEEGEREQSHKGTLELGEESGSISEAVERSSGDALAAQPSMTSLADVAPDVPDGGTLPTRLGLVAPDVPNGRTLPTRLGPVRIRIGDSGDWVGIGLAMQLQFDYLQQFAGAGASKSDEEVLQFRRLRTTLSSSFIEGRIISSLQLNLSPTALELIDLWLAFTRLKLATLRLGQFKIPYDRYREQSFAALSFIDWAPNTRMFGSERQIGVEVLAIGALFKLEYAAGIFTGVNARASHAVGISEVYGLNPPPNPSALGTGDVVRDFHPELAGRVAKNFGAINTDTNSDVTGEKTLRHSVGVGVAWDARPIATQDLGLRLSAEWLAKISGFYVNVVSYLAWYEPWQGGEILFGPMGFMAEAGYRFSLIWELALRYSTTYLTPWLRSDARSYGEAQIANASDPAAAQAQFGQNGNQITNDELALAGTAHIIGNSLRVMAQAAWESQLWVQGRQNGLVLNLQLQFLF